MKLGVAAVVVTRDRREKLAMCLDGILGQTVPADEVILLDNCSTDGTEDMVTRHYPSVTYVPLPENIGGAGGFHNGVRIAYEHGHHWYWLMDDDAIPDPDALEHLVNAGVVLPDVGFLCSRIRDLAGKPVNLPAVRSCVQTGSQSHAFDEFMDRGAIRVVNCTFVSVLIARAAVEEAGLPIKEFFIYGDDTEYTERISAKHSGYYVHASCALHLVHQEDVINLKLVDHVRLDRFMYQVRNCFYLNRKRGGCELMWFCGGTVPVMMIKAMRRKDHRLRAFLYVLLGLLRGIVFRPRIIEVRVPSKR